MEELTKRAGEIESSYKAWQAAREEVRRLDLVAERFREHDDQRTRKPFVVGKKRLREEMSRI